MPITIDTYAQTPKYIRVCLLEDASSLRLKINGFYEVIDLVSNKVLYRGKHLNTTITTYKRGLLLGATKAETNKVLVKVDEPEEVTLDGRRFRGNLWLIKKENLSLLVLNNINLEDYIKGILYHEASHYWPQEALKAQAVVCRTYAVYQMQQNRLKPYDVTSDIYSQVYGGKTSERLRTNKIVEQTKGEVLFFQNKAFPAYYHATCGGFTEDASLLWNIDLPPLKGVRCSFCRNSPHFNWQRVLSLDEIEAKLISSGNKITEIKNIVVLGKDKSGRVTDLNIVSDKKKLKISAKDLRNIIGPNVIRSTNFNVNVVDKEAVFEGFGWGHGVGLCQWGAYFLAKGGATYKDILQYYYPKSDVTTLRF